jgi:ribosome biogenesis GTPase
MTLAQGKKLSTQDNSNSNPISSSALAEYGLTPELSAQLHDGEWPARVVRADRLFLQVVTEHGPAQVPRPLGSAHQDPGATGDWLALHTGANGEPEVARVLPRTSQLIRKAAFDNSTESQVLAANIDLIGVVVPIDRAVSENRLERMLVAAWDSGATPLIILTKADLADGVNGNREVVADALRFATGVEVFTTSAAEGDGIEQLRQRVLASAHAATLTFLGPSGAGKSSLINALVGAEVQDTGEVREGDFKGKHTTTSRELIPLPGGGVLMDTPGVRGFQTVDAEEGITAVFGDIEELFADCRFGDCGHGNEPGCAVQAAIGSGALEPRRWQSYQKMQREMARLATRKVAAAARAESRSRGREYRNFKKIQEQSRRQRY